MYQAKIINPRDITSEKI